MVFLLELEQRRHLTMIFPLKKKTGSGLCSAVFAGLVAAVDEWESRVRKMKSLTRTQSLVVILSRDQELLLVDREEFVLEAHTQMFGCQ